MAARLATFSSRRLSRRSMVMGPRAQFLHSMVKPNTRIEGAPPTRKKLSQSSKNLSLSEELGSFGIPDPCISETNCTQHWMSSICPKPDIFVNYCDYEQYFVAYSLEEVGTMSPKYYVYPPPILAKFSGASCNGLLHFRAIETGHALWNPTTGDYKILPKPFVDHSPNVTYSSRSVRIWYDHRFEDYKVLNLVAASFKDEEGISRDSSYHIDLYSLKTNSWKRIPCTGFHRIYGEGNACVSGVFYCEAELNQTHVMLSFDFSSETLSSLPRPGERFSRYYFEYKGLLSCLECFDDNDYIFRRNEPCKYEVWIMSDGSWTRESVFHTRGVKEPVWFSPDGRLLYFASVTDELVVFDRAVGKLKYVGVDWSPNKYQSTDLMMIPFFESFVQLN